MPADSAETTSSPSTVTGPSGFSLLLPIRLPWRARWPVTTGGSPFPSFTAVARSHSSPGSWKAVVWPQERRQQQGTADSDPDRSGDRPGSPRRGHRSIPTRAASIGRSISRIAARRRRRFWKQVQAVDVTVLPKGKGDPILHRLNGSSSGVDDWLPLADRLRPGNAHRIRPVRRAGQFVVGRLSVLQSPVGLAAA